jgi:multisubunit Na+/H+ antiporter MnhB subunit
MYTIRHYTVRLRWSKRPPYVIARAVLRLAMLLVVGLVVLVLLGALSFHSLVELVQRH